MVLNVSSLVERTLELEKGAVTIVLFYQDLSVGLHSPAASTGSRAVLWTPPAGHAGREPEQTRSG